MLEAINTPEECFTGARRNVLRVVAAYPLDAGIDFERSKEIKSAMDADPHPLATMNCFHLRWYAHDLISAGTLPEKTS